MSYAQHEWRMLKFNNPAQKTTDFHFGDRPRLPSSLYLSITTKIHNRDVTKRLLEWKSRSYRRNKDCSAESTDAPSGVVHIAIASHSGNMVSFCTTYDCYFASAGTVECADT